ncbi:MAG TPA: hypothetical protein VGR62_10755 [Candidatus Binatia bacterium]|jgi:hypothetical protein|nr:hypothetical protein [Candidatus Binatia bacterium]
MSGTPLRWVATLLGLLMFGGAAARPAHAVGEGLGWTPPDYLSSDGETGLAPSLGLLADGTPVATWAETSQGLWYPVVASKPLAGSWSDPSAISEGPIDAPGLYSFGPRMAVASNGTYVAAWLVHRDQAKGDDTFVNQAVVEGATGSVSPGAPPTHSTYFFAGRHPPNGFTYGYTPEVILTQEGHGVVKYPYFNCCGGSFAGMTGIVGSATTGTPGDPPTSIVSLYDGGTNDDGNPTIPPFAVAGRSSGWDSSANETMALIVTRAAFLPDPRKAELRTTGNPATWPSTGITLPIPGFGAALGVLSSGAVIATAPSGDGKLLLWRTGDSSATPIDDDIGVASNKATIATFHDGSAAIAYMADDPANGVFRIRAVLVSGTGSISGPFTLSAPDAVARNPFVAYAPDGTIHVVWSQGAGTIGAETAGVGTGVYATYKLPDGEFPAIATPVIDGIAAAHRPRMVVAKDGFATVVAQIKVGSNWRIAAFTHANPAIPKSITPPEISYDGDLAEGTVLGCSTGTWTADPTAYAFEWLVDGTALGPPAPANTLTVQASDLGHAIVCRVTASNQAGSGKAESAAVTPGSTIPSNTLPISSNPTLDKTGTTATLTATAPGPGSLTAGSPTTGALAAAARAKKPKPQLPLLEPVTLRVDAAGPVQLTVKLSKAGKKAFRKKRKKGLAAPVRIGFTPDGGTEGVQTVDVLFKKPKKGGK